MLASVRATVRAIAEPAEHLDAVLVELKRRFVLALERERVGEVRPRVSRTKIVADSIADGRGLVEVRRRAIEPLPGHL